MKSSSNLTEIPFAFFDNLFILKFVLLYLGFWSRNISKRYALLAFSFGLLILVWVNLNSLKVISFKGRFPGCTSNVIYVRQLDIMAITFWFSFNAMYLVENNGNLSETKKMFFVSKFPNPFSKWENFCLIWEKIFS